MEGFFIIGFTTLFSLSLSDRLVMSSSVVLFSKDILVSLFSSHCGRTGTLVCYLLLVHLDGPAVGLLNR